MIKLFLSFFFLLEAVLVFPGQYQIIYIVLVPLWREIHFDS